MYSVPSESTREAQDCMVLVSAAQAPLYDSAIIRLNERGEKKIEDSPNRKQKGKLLFSSGLIASTKLHDRRCAWNEHENVSCSNSRLRTRLGLSSQTRRKCCLIIVDLDLLEKQRDFVVSTGVVVYTVLDGRKHC